MRLVFALVLASACGRVNFDPLTDGRGNGDGGGSGSGSGTDGGGNSVCGGANPSCGATAGSLSLNGSHQSGNDTRTLGNGQSGSCGGANANEFTVTLTALQAGTYRFSSDNSQFDTVLYIRDSCGGVELVCADVPGGTETVTLPVAQGQSILVVVDGADECGVFQLRASSI